MTSPSAPTFAAPAIAAALFTVVAWASAFVAIRAAGEHLSPGPLSLLRVGIAAVILSVAMLLRRETVPIRGTRMLVITCGVLWFGVYNIALNAGEQRVDAGTAAMLVYIGPILIALLAGWLLGEGFPRAVLVGCAVSFVGVTVIALAISDGIRLNAGALLCVAAACLYAGGVVSQKPALARNSSLSVTWGGCIAGLAVCLPFAPQLVRELGDAPADSTAWGIYLGIVPTAIAFTTWAYALSRTTAGKMASVSYLVPALAVLMGWVILGETPEALALVGGAIVLAGVVVAQRRSPVPAPPE